MPVKRSSPKPIPAENCDPATGGRDPKSSGRPTERAMGERWKAIADWFGWTLHNWTDDTAAFVVGNFPTNHVIFDVPKLVLTSFERKMSGKKVKA